jgi:TRAP-type C4-dicarboxylate transport system substrate-binding protein
VLQSVILAVILMSISVTGISANKIALTKSIKQTDISKNNRELIFAYWPPLEAEICKLGFEAWGHELEDATDGRIKIKFFGGSNMGAPVSHYKLAKTGLADISVFVPEFTPGIFPLSGIANLPMIFPSSEAAALALYQFHMKYTANTELKDVKILATSPTAPAQLLTRDKQVRTLKDLKDMKIATTSTIQARLIELLGATPVFMTDRELYTSLSRGLTDGRFTEWHGASVWEVMKITRFRTVNINLALNQMLIVMNWDSWNSLPPDIQSIITGASGLHLSRYLGIVFDRANNRSLSKLQTYDKEVGNPEMYRLSDSERQRWIEAVQPFIEHWVIESEAQGYPARDALKDVLAWLEQYKTLYEPSAGQLPK